MEDSRAFNWNEAGLRTEKRNNAKHFKFQKRYELMQKKRKKENTEKIL
jgi:hypothetical protein